MFVCAWIEKSGQCWFCLPVKPVVCLYSALTLSVIFCASSTLLPGNSWWNAAKYIQGAVYHQVSCKCTDTCYSGKVGIVCLVLHGIVSCLQYVYYLMSCYFRSAAVWSARIGRRKGENLGEFFFFFFVGCLWCIMSFLSSYRESQSLFSYKSSLEKKYTEHMYSPYSIIGNNCCRRGFIHFFSLPLLTSSGSHVTRQSRRCETLQRSIFIRKCNLLKNSPLHSIHVIYAYIGMKTKTIYVRWCNTLLKLW